MLSDIFESAPVPLDVIRLRRADGFRNPDDIYDMTTYQSISNQVEPGNLVHTSGQENLGDFHEQFISFLNQIDTLLYSLRDN